MQKLSADEQAAIEAFKTSVEQQAEMVTVLIEEGAKYGRAFTEAMRTKISPAILSSNSGRMGVADILRAQLIKDAHGLRRLGQTDQTIAAFLAAVAKEWDWIGVSVEIGDLPCG